MVFTSYFANIKNISPKIKRVSISRFPPKWAKYNEEMLLLAPSKKLLSDYKSGLVGEEGYEIRYREQLNKLDAAEIAQKLEGSVVLCYEKDGEFCHRSILAQWLRESGFEAEEYVKKEFIIKTEMCKRFSVEECKKNPDKVYVFGDNLCQRGKAGQAVIRGCKNAVGVPTKRAPSMKEGSFFSDKEDEIMAVKIALRQLYKLGREGKTIVFPSDGLGTRLAKMKGRSPKLFAEMNEIISKYFLPKAESGQGALNVR